MLSGELSDALRLLPGVAFRPRNSIGATEIAESLLAAQLR